MLLWVNACFLSGVHDLLLNRMDPLKIRQQKSTSFAICHNKPIETRIQLISILYFLLWFQDIHAIG